MIVFVVKMVESLSDAQVAMQAHSPGTYDVVIREICLNNVGKPTRFL